MIIKELDSIEISDKFEKAGYHAESQLAFYLKRAFEHAPKLLIFNNLRFENQGDSCQIDHLILHQYGLIIIESKSVTTRVEVNEFGEWKRLVNNAWKGMSSPILQAQRQGDFLRNYLEKHSKILRKKSILGKQLGFEQMPIDILIAISDSGIINRPKNDKLERVCKADQVPEKVKTLFADYSKSNSFLSLRAPFELDKDEISKISRFFLSHHKLLKHSLNNNKSNVESLEAAIADVSLLSSKSSSLTTTNNKADKKIILKTPKPVNQYHCAFCQSQNLSILFGHSYYFKCHDCGQNTGIKNICPTCGDRQKTRKRKLEFFAECEKCGTSELFHTNPANFLK